VHYGKGMVATSECLVAVAIEVVHLAEEGDKLGIVDQEAQRDMDILVEEDFLFEVCKTALFEDVLVDEWSGLEMVRDEGLPAPKS
jgi:hypothetical protein